MRMRMVELAAAGTEGVAKASDLVGEAVTGPAFMLRPVTTDQLVIISVLSLRRGESSA